MKLDVKDIIPQGRKSVINDLLNAIRGVCFLPLWYFQRFHKRDASLWTFGAWSGERYSDNSRALYEYVLAHHPEIHAVWMTRSPQIFERLQKEGRPVAMIESNEGKRVQRDAGFFFMTSNLFDGDVRQMNGIRFVNLWHGMPLKKIGEDAMERIRSKSLWKRIKTKIRKIVVPWEFISGPTLCGSSFFYPYFKTAFCLTDKTAWPIIEPRISKLTGRGGERLTCQLDEQYGQPLKVLYMPTFRDDKVGTFNPFALAPGFDKKRFEQLLEKENIVFLYKGHFVDEFHTTESNQGRFRVINDNDYDDLYRFLNDIDVLVTDYSSIYFDFLYVHKPIILFPFDYDDYIAKAREFYFDYQLLEAIRVYSWEELEECLRNRNYHAPSEEEVKRFCDDQKEICCEQIVAYCLKL